MVGLFLPRQSVVFLLRRSSSTTARTYNQFPRQLSCLFDGSPFALASAIEQDGGRNVSAFV